METRTCSRCYNVFQTTGTAFYCSLCFNAIQEEKEHDRRARFATESRDDPNYEPGFFMKFFMLLSAYCVFGTIFGFFLFFIGTLFDSKIIMYIAGAILASIFGLITHILFGAAIMSTGDFNGGLNKMLEYFTFVFGNFPT